MKLLKILGIILACAAVFCILGVIGRAETDDRLYASGEISADKMLTTEKLLKYALAFGAVALIGGLCWAVGTYIEAGHVEREFKRTYGRITRGTK